jgi:hypothetical protein
MSASTRSVLGLFFTAASAGQNPRQTREDGCSQRLAGFTTTLPDRWNPSDIPYSMAVATTTNMHLVLAFELREYELLPLRK